jgi:two-component system chemotaxis response regulator CheB
MTHRDIVVIGASAGGVPALRQLASQLPPEFPATVLVVLHVGTHPSSLPFILGVAGLNPAEHAVDGQVLVTGRILVAPPDHHLLLEDGVVRLTRGPKEHHTRPAIDPLFRSAAITFGPRVIGVVLTGLLDDGTAGLQAIKALGGLAVVQDPATAEEPSMPRSALQAVAVDHCVPLEGMAELLVRLVQQPVEGALPVDLAHTVALEHDVSLGGESAMEELQAVANPSTFVCPDCQGTLWELRDARPTRYRCHTGHAFSLRSLTGAQEEKTDEALWSAIRALQEKEALVRKVAALDLLAGDSTRAATGEMQAHRIGEQLKVLRRLVEGG